MLYELRVLTKNIITPTNYIHLYCFFLRQPTVVRRSIETGST